MIAYIFNLLMIMLVALPVYLLLYKPWREDSARAWVKAAFAMFMLGLLVLTLQGQYRSPSAIAAYVAWRLESGEQINLVPFHTIAGLFEDFSAEAFLVNVVGNIVMFMPWGFGLVLLWKRKQRFLSVVLHSLALPVFIESWQLFIGRWVDVDDIILNFTGGCLGAALYFAVRKRAPDLAKLAR